ncbi:hypothetical protein CH373_13350 [Leptospira perolatii]|uniref:Response regulatory domain-containing protein n=1 Tax=Leptospira perolatii TaxID=2023191 RepID=A0A2M9ZKT9_9LEPT|nr:response regulator [Leptospira perolatii]PJZ69906.1 hypothetical protein CH360_08335 [Leptospira perolatii]PJZ72686.1 hypothetical protein CH373_13350 [Leptospira perolatii]
MVFRELYRKLLQSISTMSFPSKFRILIVDPGKVTRRIISDEFASEEYEVKEAINILHASELASKEFFNLITVGVYLEEGTGFDFCKKVRHEILDGKPYKSRNASILVVTSDYSNENRKKATEAGADGFIEKSADLTIFRSVIASILKDAYIEKPNLEVVDKPVTKKRKILNQKINKKILIVDDSEMNLVILKRLLEIRGGKVDTATSGEDALSILSRDFQDYFAILTDLYMPGISGLVLCETIKSIYGENSLVFAITSAAAKEDLKEQKIPDWIELLMKPYVTDHIVEFLNEKISE